ncbi:MAG: hypothetical protein D6698_12275 [Gammaproteobacteria bacterium]|nr:MAG: hypothetical protein D6698_12275 [Gammaproteobacteria bacterium]
MSTFASMVSTGSDEEPIQSFDLPETHGARHVATLKSTGERVVIVGHQVVKEQTLDNSEPVKRHRVLIVLFERLATVDQLELIKIVMSDEAQHNDFLIGDTENPGVLGRHTYRNTQKSWFDFLCEQGIPRGLTKDVSALALSKIMAVVDAGELIYANKHQEQFIYGKAAPVNAEAAKRKKAVTMYNRALEKMRRGEPLLPEEKHLLGDEIGFGKDADVINAKMENLENTVNQLANTVNQLAQLVAASATKEEEKPKTAKKTTRGGRRKKTTTTASSEEAA